MATSIQLCDETRKIHKQTTLLILHDSFNYKKKGCVCSKYKYVISFNKKVNDEANLMGIIYANNLKKLKRLVLPLDTYLNELGLKIGNFTAFKHVPDKVNLQDFKAFCVVECEKQNIISNLTK